jgi:predicted flap endonuclease-1-like 5' DNA nuclease
MFITFSKLKLESNLHEPHFIITSAAKMRDALMVERRELIIWISAFATFLAMLSSVAMSVQLINDGADSIARPYILGDIIGSLAGDLNVATYLWISIAATFLLLGFTCIMAFSKPLDTEILRMLVNVKGNLDNLRRNQEESLSDMASHLEYNQKANQRFFVQVNSKVEDTRKELFAHLGRQGNALKKRRRDLVTLVENKANETGEKLSSDLKEQEKVMMDVKQVSENSAAALKRQRAELKTIKLKLEKIEENIVPVQAELTSLDDPKAIKGIGPHLGKELRGLGITSVREFLTADPAVIGEKTRLSQEMAENLQVTAQLLMIPGLSEKDAELLAEAGIKSRKQLADQDLIQFSRKVGKIAKIHVDEGKISEDDCPTIEEISSWIRMAK